MTREISLIYVTFPSEKVAVDIAKKLLESKLIACINVLAPIKSFYPWEGRVENSEEVPTLLKLPKNNVPETIKKIQKLHPYDTPAILEIPVGRVGDSFCDWLHHALR